MKVDKRYKMYGVTNAAYCGSMLLREWSSIKEYIVDKFGQGMHVYKPILSRLTADILDSTNYWYIEYEDGIVTVYFPTEDDIDFIMKCKTFGALNEV